MRKCNVSKMRVRYEWCGIDPARALVVTNLRWDYEVSVDEGDHWDTGAAGTTLGDVAMWMLTEDYEIDRIEEIPGTRRNGRSGYRCEYAVSFRKKAFHEPEEPLWVKEELPNPVTGWLKAVHQDVDWVSVPGVEDVKPHRAPQGHVDGWTVV